MLKFGSRGDSVEKLQQDLADAGFDPGPIDGIFGAKTEAALRAYQNSVDIEPDGVYGPDTDESLTGGEQTSADGETGEEGSGGTIDEVREFMEQNFPTFLWAVDHAEIGPILQEAAEEEWESLRIQGALQGTDWWKNTSETARQAKLLQENDPAEWKRRMDAKREEVRAAAESMGLSVTNSQLSSISSDALTMGFNPQQLEQAIIANSNYNDISLEQLESGEVGGTLSQTENAVEAVIDNWMLEMPNATKMKWIRDISEGRKTVDSLRSYAETMARKNMPYISDLIDQGLTATEIMRPYQDVMAEMLEMPSTSIDMSDSRFHKSMQTEDGQLAPVSDIKRQIRENYFNEWNQTGNARQSAVKITTSIANMFGRRA